MGVMEMASTANRDKEQAKTELETTVTELKNVKVALKNLRQRAQTWRVN